MKSNKYIFILFLCLFSCSIVSAETDIAISTYTVTNESLGNNNQTITLKEYQEMALKNNHDLHKIKLESEMAEQTSKGAFTKYFPKIVAGGGIANTNILPGLTTPISILPITDQSNGASVMMLSVTQPLFTGGRIVNGNKLAKSAMNASLYKLQIKQNEVFAEAEKKYRQFQLLQGKMQTIISYEKMLDSLYSQVSQAFELGISSKSDYLRVKLKKEEISVQKSQLSKMIEIAKKDLKLFAVLAEEYDVHIDKEFLTIEEPSFNTDNFSTQLKERPEYKLLQINVEVAKLQKSMKVGSYLPTVAVGASLFRTDYFSDNHFDRSAMNYQDTIAFGMVSIPLSDWWEASHSIKEMKIQYDSAQEQLESMGKYLLLDMESKLTQLETSYEQVKVAKIGLELAQTNKLESEDGYKNGTEKLSDYLEALALEQEKENKLDEAKANYFQAKTAFLISTANLEY